MLVSIVMPVYNGERFLREAIDSIQAQTLEAFELIVVDDGSTDSTKGMVRSLAASDRRVKAIWQDHKGIVEARTRGVMEAQSDLIAMMDCDDRMHPDRLARQIRYLNEHRDVAVCCTWAHLIDSTGKRIGYSNHRVDVSEGKRLLDPSRFLEIVNPSAVVRKTAFLGVGGYRDMCPAEDRDLWGRLVTSGYPIRCLEEYLLDYRLHGTSTTVRKQKRWLGNYVDLNVTRRLRGLQELPLEAYWELRRAMPLPERWALWCREVSMANYKRAVREFGEGERLKCALAMSRAAAFRPFWAFSRAYSAWKPESM